MSKSKTLKEIALELLEKYRKSEETGIYECSGFIKADLASLETECDELRKQIEEITEPRWIPVDGQVPNNEVLCCDKYGNIMIGSVYESYASETGFNSVSEDSIIEYGIMYGVTAWMPLPEPYQQEDESK